jgi:hypothetical protein
VEVSVNGKYLNKELYIQSISSIQGSKFKIIRILKGGMTSENVEAENIPKSKEEWRVFSQQQLNFAEEMSKVSVKK